MTADTKILAEGWEFGECPRWHDGKLWFSDVQGCKVRNVNLDGEVKTIAEWSGNLLGLGWLPNGELRVVSAEENKLLALKSDGLKVVADFSHITTGRCNDLVIDEDGRAYVGHMAPRPKEGESDLPGDIVMVLPDGEVSIAATDMRVPNGMVITPGRNELIVAETVGKCLTAFKIESDGLLTKRRLWADLGEILPDGICFDLEGAVWVASIGPECEVIRVREGGEVTQRVKTTKPAFACMLGGIESRTLFITTSELRTPDGTRSKDGGRLETIEVDVPGAGLP